MIEQSRTRVSQWDFRILHKTKQNNEVTFWSKELFNFSISSSWSFSIALQQQKLGISLKL